MRRRGGDANARARKPNVVPRWVSSGSISAVGARCAAGEPLSVAHGLLWRKK
jgi:hypothetical protein